MMHKDSIYPMCKDCLNSHGTNEFDSKTVMTLGTLGTLMLDSRTIEQMNLNRETIMMLGRLMLNSV